MIYCAKSETLKSVLNIKVLEILSFVAKLNTFDHGTSPIAEKIHLERYRKDLGSGAFYDGYWSSSGLRCGLGTQIDADAVYYIGYWLNDYKHGRGRLVNADETIYEGNFKGD